MAVDRQFNFPFGQEWRNPGRHVQAGRLAGTRNSASVVLVVGLPGMNGGSVHPHQFRVSVACAWSSDCKTNTPGCLSRQERVRREAGEMDLQRDMTWDGSE